MSNLGWECPICHSVYAPTITRCESCSMRHSSNDPTMGRQLEDAIARRKLRPDVEPSWPQNPSWPPSRPIVMIGDPPGFTYGTWSASS